MIRNPHFVAWATFSGVAEIGKDNAKHTMALYAFLKWRDFEDRTIPRPLPVFNRQIRWYYDYYSTELYIDDI